MSGIRANLTHVLDVVSVLVGLQPELEAVCPGGVGKATAATRVTYGRNVICASSKPSNTFAER